MSALRVAIAGSSGSIGTQTIEVIRAERDRYEVVGLGVRSATDVLVEQARELRPKVVAVADPAQRAEVAKALPFAEVYVDDRSAGYTPMACLRVAIGDHRVRFEMDGQRSPDRMLKISARHTPDAPLRLSYDFNRGRFIEQ